MIPGYNTNGFAHHRLEDAIDILADLGYRSVALTLDYHCLNPFDPDLGHQSRRVRQQLERHRMRCVIETGARFLLDRWHKHQPTLLDPDPVARQIRFDFLCRAVDLAVELNADAVSFWSGTAKSSEPAEILLERLAEGCRRLAEYAERRSARLAFEPEPGMFIDTMARMGELYDRVRQYPNFGLTLDIGHLQCLGEVPMRSHILRWEPILWNVHIEDMKSGVHDHLMFGEGEINFAEVIAALREVNYAGGLHVELSRHSHDAVRTAQRSIVFWNSLMG